MDELTKDLCELSRYIWELSKKYGGININATCVGANLRTNHSWTTISKKSGIETYEYWSQSGSYTKNITEKIIKKESEAQ